MKKKFLMLIALLAGVASTYADDMFTVTSAGIPKGAQGTIAIGLPTTNTNTYAAFQITLVLPEGLEFKSAENGDLLSTHSISFSGTTTVKISGSATPTTNFTDTSGTLCVLTVSADANAATGNLTIKAGGDFSLLTYYDGTNDILGFDETHEITITDGIILDENSTVLPAAQQNVDVTVNRTIKAGVWNTIYLPFNVINRESVFGADAQFATLSGCTTSGNIISVNFSTHSGGLKANTPYLVKIGGSNDKESLTISGVNITPKDGQSTDFEDNDFNIIAKFIGTLKKFTVPQYDLFISNNNFYYSNGTSTLKGFRGYFWIKDFVESFSEGASAPQLNLNIDGETTSVTILRLDSDAFTIEDGKIYDLKGMQVDNPQKGIYIQNGKKIVIK